MFTHSFFKHHHDFYIQQDDVWLQMLLQLHIAADYKNERDFKLKAISELRNSNVYKLSKINIEQVEDNLLNCQKLSLFAFCALALLYQVNITVVLGNLYFVIGNQPTYFVDHTNSIKKLPSSNFSELHCLKSLSKPLNAMSYYNITDLENIVSRLRLSKGSKTYMYNGIQNYIRTALFEKYI